MPNKFHKIKKIASGEQLTKVREAWIFKNGEFHKVWSGASEVSYYDGDTLLGTAEVDEGEDVLHPSIDTTKSGYTLYGWATRRNIEERVESLNATGDPMVLYAIYIANSITVAQSDRILDSKYVSGALTVSTTATWNTTTASAGFTINLGKYQNAQINARVDTASNDTGNLTVGGGNVDGVGITDWLQSGRSASKTFNIGNGGHSLGVWAVSYEDYRQTCWIHTQWITLSNPIAWV